ncbi:Fe(2+) transporter permease subunit FeoB [Halomonas cupida]|uniref:Fe(2+) transporter permease subunit FeoB n=1 Tax=Halomonas cupida TaxID=44933 RepID=UPI003A93D941
MIFRILVIGNPNSGKSTLFNKLTGAKQRVGNWSGVTVDKKVGRFDHDSCHFEITDLPGVYHLNGDQSFDTLDESIAIGAIESLPADLVINVVDASTLERSLYLTLQLLESGRPMLVVLNKMDVVARQQQKLNISGLQQRLGCPVIALSAHEPDDIRSLKDRIKQVISRKQSGHPFRLDYGEQLESAIDVIQLHLDGYPTHLTRRSHVLRFIEGQDSSLSELSIIGYQQAKLIRDDLLGNVDVDIVVADIRYSFIHELVIAVRHQRGRLSRRLSDRIDDVVMSRWLGLPIFLFVMYIMFMFSVDFGSAFIDFFDILVGTLLVDGVHFLFDGVLPVWVVTLLADGFGGGVRTVATFIPVIACLYLCMSLLESSGYMARAAFVLDKLMRKVGLPGKAFVPLVLGFGCNVPSVMATRNLDHERERRLSAAMVPFMSCGARLPVYALFAVAFFPENGQNVVFLLYLVGILVAIMTGLLLRHTLYPGINSSFVMEIPDYELPTVNNVLLKTWQKLKRFVLGAGKTIVLVVACLSMINSFGMDGSFARNQHDNSLLAEIARGITPILSPMGIEEDNWQATVGLVTGIFAKEVLVGTLNELYGPPQDEEVEYDPWASLHEAVASIPQNFSDLDYADPIGVEVGDVDDPTLAAEEQQVDVSIYGNLQQHFPSASAAMAYLLFVLLYTPCVAAIGAYVREFGRRYALFIVTWTLFVAYGVSTLYYQFSMVEAMWRSAVIWGLVFTALSVVWFLALRCYGRRLQELSLSV